MLMDSLKAMLIKRYVEILNKAEYQDLLRKTGCKESGFSNVHLGSVPENYEIAEHKILIVGRETRGWLKGKQFDGYCAENVENSISCSRDWMKENLTGKLKRGTRGSTFFNFVRKVAKRSGYDGILWANIFAIDYKKSHPKYSDMFEEIKKLSRELLCAQIDILKPDIILFVSGNGGIKARREYFPNLVGSGESIDGIEKSLLERFFFQDGDYQKIACYRAPHPSTRKPHGKRALKKLIELLPVQMPELEKNKNNQNSHEDC